MITGSKALIRDINSTLVMEEVIRSGPISRAALSKILGLTKATISAIIQEFLKKNLIIEIGSDNTSMGRKPILLEFNKNYGYAICVDIGVDNLTALCTNLGGENSHICRTASPSLPEQFAPSIIQLIKTVIQHSSAPRYFVGITLAIHGVIAKNQVSFAPYYMLSDIDLASLIQDYFHVPVILENEANLSVIGEKTFMYDYPNIANISVHSGIGLGLILNHELYTGYNGRAGEIGHTIIEIGGRPCPCGNSGCLEQYTSERVLLRDFADKKNCSLISSEQFLEFYHLGDKDALFIMEQFIKYMSVCVNNVLNMYNPDIVIINSSFLVSSPDLIVKIENSLTSRMNSFVQIVPSALQDTSTLLGGICVAVKQFLGIHRFHLSPISLPPKGNYLL